MSVIDNGLSSPCPISAHMLGNWQKLITSVAEAIRVPAGLVTRIVSPDLICMQVSSSQPGNPYRQGSVDPLLAGMYCARVLGGNGRLAVADATAGGLPSLNPDVELGMIAYLGYPVSWPDGRLFGTICVLDNQPMQFNPDARHIMDVAREAIEADLSTIQRPANPKLKADGRTATRLRSSKVVAPSTGALLWDYDVDSGLVRLSRAAARFFGLSPLQNAIDRDDWLSLFSPTSQQDLSLMLDELATAPDLLFNAAVVVDRGPHRSSSVLLHARGLTDRHGRLRWIMGSQFPPKGDVAAFPTPSTTASATRVAPSRLVVDSCGTIIHAAGDHTALLGGTAQALLGASLLQRLGENDRASLRDSIDCALHEHVSDQVFRWTPAGAHDSRLVSISSISVDGRILGADLCIRESADAECDDDSERWDDRVMRAPLSDATSLEDRLDQMRVDFALVGRRHSLLVVEIHDLDRRTELDGYDLTCWQVHTLSIVARRCAPGHVVADVAFGKVGIAAWDTSLADVGRLASRIMGETQADIARVGPSCRLSAGIVAVESLSCTMDQFLRMAFSASTTAIDLEPPVGFYAPGNHLADERYQRSLMAHSVRDALQEDRVIIHGQPIVPLRKNGESFGRGFEILARMLDERGALVPAALFIPAAEEFGLIAAIDLLVLRKAIAALSAAPEDIHFNVNLSALSLGRTDLWPYTARLIEQAGISPARLTFEITESGLMTGTIAARSFVGRARAAGCRIALDDFGTGMSSFAYLSEFGVDFIKIDRSFVRASTLPGTSRMLVESMNDLAHRLGARSVAEGIESEQHEAAMREIGIDLGQGYFIGHPRELVL